MALPEMLSGLGQPPVTPAPAPAPPPTPFSGTHYSKEKIKGSVLHGDKRGSTGEGEDSDRVFLPPRGAPAAVHVYEDNGQLFGKHPQILARPHAYHVGGNFSLADIDTNETWIQAKQEVMNNTQSQMDPNQAELTARNEAEWKLKEAGYHGYKSSKTPGNVVLFGDHEATHMDKLAKMSGDEGQEGSDQAQAAPDASMAESIPDGGESGSPDSAGSNPGTFALGHAVPMNPPDEHESHPPQSDPASLGKV